MKKTRKDYPLYWDEIATRIKKRDGYRCQDCGVYFGQEAKMIYITNINGQPKRLTLGVHHKDRNIKNNDDSNLISLCSSCHCKWELPLIRKELRAKKHKNQIEMELL